MTPPLLPREEAIVRMQAYQDALEQALARGGPQYDAVFDKPPGRIIAHEIDANKVIERVNRFELELLGYREDQMVGRPVWEFIVMQEVAQRAMDKKLSGTVELKPFVRTFVRADSSPLPMVLLDRLRRDARGTIIGIRTVGMETPGGL
jgi:PAS domain S-box-containing protein